MKEGTETALYNQGYMDGFDDAEKDKDTPDYWARLEHQYAGMAMHGILSNSEYLRSLMHTKYNDYRAHEVVPNVAVRLSHALVEKLKEERKLKTFCGDFLTGW